MSEFVIEKGIAIPETKAKTKYPWDQMEPDDSFLLPGDDFDVLINRAKAAVTVRNRAERGTFKAGRDPEGKGARIWRIK